MLLEVEDLAGGYGAARVLHGVTLAAARGAVTALLGANGAGKTTLMRTLAGLLPAAGGAIRFAGAEVTALPAAARVERGIALVPEGRLVFPALSVAENLRLGAIAPRARAGWRTRADEMYALFPRLRERARQPAGALSGGEQQMLAIARGLMSRPDLVLLDEPTLGLAPAMVRVVFDTIERMRALGLAVLLAEQDVRRALQAADAAYVIEHGRVIAAGRGADLAADARVRRAYFGVD
ncbi:MAG: ABC transporter ATP-binding protein [Burkholderiales bacterium]|nr:ABC transporter ATP-binding protein [Burkholderiales bacterium]